MRAMPANVERQIADAYRRMAVEARYRPAAPSDGFGNITVAEELLDLDAEAREYAARWWQQEDKRRFTLGCANYEERTAMIFALEAARFCCSGLGSRPFARQLLEMALEELGDG